MIDLSAADYCSECGKVISFQFCPTGGWWSHFEHPADGHDAEPTNDHGNVCVECGECFTLGDLCALCEDQIGPTDFDALTTLFDAWGVPWLKNDPDGPPVPGDQIQVKVEQAASDTVTGYNEFYTLFEFDKDGNFLRMGAWE
jgi:hypothetical protein